MGVGSGKKGSWLWRVIGLAEILEWTACCVEFYTILNNNYIVNILKHDAETKFGERTAFP